LKILKYSNLKQYGFMLGIFLISVFFVTETCIHPAHAAKEEKSAVELEKGNSTPAAKRNPGSKININKADQATLEKLPGIGPGKAKAIINGRPYKNIEDVMRVSDIKKRTFDTIKNEIVVE